MWPFKSRRTTVLYTVGNSPLAKLKCGDVITRVWLNRDGDDRHVYQVAYSRLEKDKKTERKSFYVDDLSNIIRGTEKAIKYMRRGPRIRRR